MKRRVETVVGRGIDSLLVARLLVGSAIDSVSCPVFCLSPLALFK